MVSYPSIKCMSLLSNSLLKHSHNIPNHTPKSTMKISNTLTFTTALFFCLLLIILSSTFAARPAAQGSNNNNNGGMGGFFGQPGFNIPGFGPGAGNNFGGGYGGGYGSGFGGPGGGYAKGGVIRPTVVCRDKGPCYKKKITCPAKCYKSFSRAGKGYGAGGGSGSCTIDCKKKCAASC